MDQLSRYPESLKMFPKDQRVLSYLPLSHVAGFAYDAASHLNYGS